MTGGLCCLLLSLSIAMPLTLALHRWASMPVWAGALLGVCIVMLSFAVLPFWRIRPRDVTRLLDSKFNELEESAGLLIKPAGELGLLERWQREHVAGKLSSIRMPHPYLIKTGWAIGALAAGLVFCLLIGASAPAMRPVRKGKEDAANPGMSKSPVPGLDSVNIRITPPAYTGKTMRDQKGLSLVVEEGALIQWELASGAVDSAIFLFNDSLRLPLQAANEQHTRWRVSLVARRAGFYQLYLGNKSSELYKFELVRDQPPQITIRTPKPYLVVDLGESLQIPVAIRLQDDYGIAGASMVATVASGSGEAVKFKEQIYRFDQPFSATVYDLHKTLDLAALGLRPGDELYYYCRAKDNHGQESRSDMYIISLPDTAQLLSLDGLSLGVDVKPEYFRSERQIILETEQLLREQDTLSKGAFRSRSNDLGIDQKLLRLRYGKFLGEEAEEGNETVGSVRADAGDSGSLVPPARGLNFIRPGEAGDATRILEAYTDKHDNAEDATYFEPATKEQLKATLTEMWGAELQLRTFHPREALPFAYKALRLLKDLQQRSRAYVAKTGVKITAPDPAKRLTGKTEGVGNPRQGVADPEFRKPTEEDILRICLSILGQECRGALPSRSAADQDILQQALYVLAREASEHPARFLEGYQALKELLSNERKGPLTSRYEERARLVQRTIRNLLPPVEPKAAPSPQPATGTLSQSYFSHINDRSTNP
jgi:hypothetical protein